METLLVAVPSYKVNSPSLSSCPMPGDPQQAVGSAIYLPQLWTLLEFWLAVQITISAVNSWVQELCHVQQFVFHTTPPPLYSFLHYLGLLVGDFSISVRSEVNKAIPFRAQHLVSSQHFEQVWVCSNICQRFALTTVL